MSEAPGSGAHGRPIARVLIDSPLPQLDRLFDYVIPPELDADALPGVRIKAPLRTAGRVVEGFLIERAVEPDGERVLSELESVVSPARVLPDGLYRLARRVADRAAGSASDVLRLAVPKRMVRAEKAWLAGARCGRPTISAAVHASVASVLAEYPQLVERIA